MTEYNKEDHRLLRDIAHQYAIDINEFSDFSNAVRDAGIDVLTVSVPDWPAVPYSYVNGWIVFGDVWWEGKTWDAGDHPAISESDHTQVRRIARDIRGEKTNPKRVAYVWNAEIFDPEKHIVLRYWLRDNELSIVDFLRDFLPKKRRELGRDILVSTTNPELDKERTLGSWSPTRRSIRVEDAHILEEYASENEKFTYDNNHVVKWVRSEDESRWEARRTHDPQSAHWATHRSWVSRPLGSGVQSDGDVSPDGYRFGPVAEMFDDGQFWLWISRRALSYMEENPIIINGYPIDLHAETVGVTCRMKGQVPVEDIGLVMGSLTEPYNVAKASESEGGTEDDGPISVENVRFSRNGKYYRAVTDLPAVFHRDDGFKIVMREENEVRYWGDEELARRGISVNGYSVIGAEPFRGGWRGYSEEKVSTIAGGRSGGEEEREGEPSEATPVPTPPVVSGNGVTSGSMVYSPSASVRAIEGALGRDVRLFGNSTSDSGIVALTRDGLREFLDQDATDRIDYINDSGERNYDCENFSESVRNNLVRKYGVNSCAVVWGDSHAWCIFIVVGKDGPEVVQVEPQSDSYVRLGTSDPAYSTSRRAEVLL